MYSNDLEITRQFPVGNRLAGREVFHEGVTEQVSRGFGGEQPIGGIIQRRR
jgi:hypothetical protein